MELLEKFGIDWRTLIAQAVNFLIVVVVLWKFAYKPVLKLLQDRSKRVEKSIKDAEHIEKRLQKIEATQKEMIKKAEAEGQNILKAAEVQAQEQSAAAMEKTRAEVKTVVTKAKKEIQAAKDSLLQEARKDMAHLMVQALEKVVQTKAGSQDQELIEKTLQEVYSHRKQ
ncbi:MAG: ATP synthase F0 subunit B [Candidatus Kerfeldbacteria bacterium RIFCSPHIGHO2_12_FULL_48_17]|uniref:ATP synthase subunit b n=1 Tax=Candidatus Kerfeldbacteria bacterium RIFCSPHIGHO2_12_FULL_48_17 TaxID=1798542 RepID=A0A1G2B8N4_9BACT|nr:MAG: ATP synthase F0 subunit B [Candidatus Kerfeldbacteria bacterium RIFCSPHIGHO2_12_FULL_48_17]